MARCGVGEELHVWHWSSQSRGGPVGTVARAHYPNTEPGPRSTRAGALTPRARLVAASIAQSEVRPIPQAANLSMKRRRMAGG